MNRIGGYSVLLAAMAGALGAACRCGDDRRVIQGPLADPSGRWVAVVDEVEYANGFLTSVADRVLIADSLSSVNRGRGTIVFSEDATPEKPTVAWSAGRLVITVSRNAGILHQQQRVDDLGIELRRR